MTTFRSFVDALEALSVTGVVRAYDQGPPKSIEGEDLPAMWVQLPQGAETPLVFGEFDGWDTYQADVVIAVEAVGHQEEPFQNFDLTVDMMDNISSALSSVASCGIITKTKHSWTIRQTIVQVSGVDYWAVVTRVTGSG